MALLQNKKILITGLLSNRSIACGIARAAHREGAALAFTYQSEELKNRVIDLAKECTTKNMWAKYKALSAADQKNSKLIDALRTLDANVNVNWPLVHYKSAVRYLAADEKEIEATGGTNWQKYLPPRFQKRIFYPELWSAEEVENWGKSWIAKEVFEL